MTATPNQLLDVHVADRQRRLRHEAERHRLLRRENGRSRPRFGGTRSRHRSP